MELRQRYYVPMMIVDLQIIAKSLKTHLNYKKSSRLYLRILMELV